MLVHVRKYFLRAGNTSSAFIDDKPTARTGDAIDCGGVVKGGGRCGAGEQQPDKPEGGRFVCGHPFRGRGHRRAENQSQ